MSEAARGPAPSQLSRKFPFEDLWLVSDPKNCCKCDASMGQGEERCLAAGLFRHTENSCTVFCHKYSDSQEFRQGSSIVGATPPTEKLVTIPKGIPVVQFIRKESSQRVYCMQCFHESGENEAMLKAVLEQAEGHAYVLNIRHNLVAPSVQSV